MMDDEDLWSDEINAFVDRAFETVSLSPSFYGEVAAYRYAIKLAIDEGRQTQTDALKIAREALRRAENAISNIATSLQKHIECSPSQSRCSTGQRK